MKEANHRYLNYVRSFSPEKPRLPLMHTTKGRGFIAIMDSMTIAPGKKDSVIDKEASFHFYGKPSYRPNYVESFSNQIGSALFCIILDLEEVPDPCGILPFDSGGYKDRFSAQCDDIDLTEFYLPVDTNSPARLVSAIYGSNRNYFLRKRREGVEGEVGRFDLHTAALLRLASSTFAEGFDQRASSIEVHLDVPIPLRRENALAIIAPDLACEEVELQNFAESLGADLVPYLFDFEESSVRQRQIRDAAHAWLSSGHYFGTMRC